jgi:hypothetical protein
MLQFIKDNLYLFGVPLWSQPQVHNIEITGRNFSTIKFGSYVYFIFVYITLTQTVKIIEKSA